MVKKLELVGQVFGQLRVLAEAPTRINASGRSQRYVLCVCVCGGSREYAVQNLRSGNSTSCGCASTVLVHGHKRNRKPSSTYRTWDAMRQRCTNPNHHAYPRYGAAGITVCADWMGNKGFVNFLRDMGERPSGTTLDRIDGTQGYSKANCRWATTQQQYENKKVIRDSHGRFCK